MKTLTITFKVISWITAILISIFTLALVLNNAFGQAVVFILIAVSLVYWPTPLKRKPKYKIYRLSFIAVLILMKIFVFVGEPKTTIYKTEEGKSELLAIYDRNLENWPSNTVELDIDTEFGKVHVLKTGNFEGKSLVMLHAAGMGAHSWAENLEPFIEDYCIYAIDNPGEGSKSELKDAMVFPSNQKEIADLYNYIFQELNLDSAVVFGASNGGFIAQSLAFHYPDMVSKLVLIGPMGITQLTNGSIAMMGLSTTYPLQFLRDEVSDWAIGSADVCKEKYGDWFNAIMKYTIPSIAAPVPMTLEQKQQMNMPVLLFLGSKDKIVGDAQTAKNMAEDYPDIQIEILESGHLVAVEHSEEINKKIEAFLED